jgi:hypothetical protein
MAMSTGTQKIVYSNPQQGGVLVPVTQTKSKPIPARKK